jgi:hypothetical protein
LLDINFTCIAHPTIEQCCTQGQKLSRSFLSRQIAAMPRIVKVAATQLEITRDPEKNLVCVGQLDAWTPAAVTAQSISLAF